MTSMSFDHNLRFAHFPLEKLTFLRTPQSLHTRPQALDLSPWAVHLCPPDRTSLPPWPYICAPLTVPLRSFRLRVA